MSWLEALTYTSGLVLRGLTRDTGPDKVLSVKPDKYGNCIIRCREDSIVLYGPTDGQYEIVLHRPCSEALNEAYSLYRSNDVHAAEIRFLELKDKVPHLIQLSKDLSSLQGIQKLCDALRENPSWSLAHLAAHFSLNECFEKPSVLSEINVPATSTGMSPLQVAVKAGNLRTVQSLLASKGVSLEHLDYEANSVYHYAATTTKEIIQALGSVSSKSLNQRNINGYTPLHLACLADKPECVKALLLAGADVNISANKGSDTATPPGNVADFLQGNANKLQVKDMKYGGTPLHWSNSREVIDALVDMGCHINAPDFEGRTALQVAVKRQRLECVVALLARGVNVAMSDNNGDTALHLAVRADSLPIVQALLAFDAPLNAKNKKQETPRHCVTRGTTGDRILWLLHAVGAERCSRDMRGCHRGCSATSTDHRFDGVPPPAPCSSQTRVELDRLLDTAALSGTPKKGSRLLCLDGGGIRGLILTVALLELEKELRKPILYCFDWIAGTSTGGILALALSCGRTLKECLALYLRLKDVAFMGSRPYNSEPLENILKECLGTNTVMADVTHPKLFITGVLADRKPVDLHIFRNYESPSSILGVEHTGFFLPPPIPEEQLVWMAARATGAAPSYFRSFGRFLDGGLIANNPTLDAMTEIHEYNLALKSVGRGGEVKKLAVVVSVGTGVVPVTQLKEVDIFRPESLWDAAKLACGISALGMLLVDQATASDGRVVDRARAWCSSIGIPYFRFSPQLSEDIAMDEKSNEKLMNMLWEAKAYMHSNRETVRKLAKYIDPE